MDEALYYLLSFIQILICHFVQSDENNKLWFTDSVKVFVSQTVLKTEKKAYREGVCKSKDFVFPP